MTMPAARTSDFIVLIATALAAALLTATPALAQQALQPGGRVTGELRAGDATLQSGEFVDSFTIEGRAGQRLVVRMTSTALDPYLLIRGPANFKDENDDESQGVSNALLDVTLPADGRYTVRLTLGEQMIEEPLELLPDRAGDDE